MLRKSDWLLLKIWLTLFSIIGCAGNADNAEVKARAGHGIATAEATVGVTAWPDDAPPLTGKKVEDAEPQGAVGQAESEADKQAEFEALKKEIEAELLRRIEEEREQCIEASVSAVEAQECEPTEKPQIVAKDRVRWLRFTEKNKRLAQQQDKPVLFHVTQDNCPPCMKAMKMFDNPALIVRINRDFFPILVNQSKMPEVQRRWRLSQYPVDMVRDPKTLLEVAREPKCPATVKLYAKRLERMAKQVKRVKYPLRSAWWTGCNDWRHLANFHVHRNKFDREWLQLLTWGELQSLHSDDHEDKVQWRFVVPGENLALNK